MSGWRDASRRHAKHGLRCAKRRNTARCRRRRGVKRCASCREGSATRATSCATVRSAIGDAEGGAPVAGALAPSPLGHAPCQLACISVRERFNLCGARLPGPRTAPPKWREASREWRGAPRQWRAASREWRGRTHPAPEPSRTSVESFRSIAALRPRCGLGLSRMASVGVGTTRRACLPRTTGGEPSVGSSRACVWGNVTYLLGLCRPRPRTLLDGVRAVDEVQS